MSSAYAQVPGVGAGVPSGTNSSHFINANIASVFPATVVSGAVGVYGTTQLVAGYTGNAIDITRISDQTTKTFDLTLVGSGRLDISSINSFLNDGVGIGYVCKLYDESGNANDAAQSVVASCPKIDTTKIQNGAPALVYDFAYRSYMAQLTTYAVTSFNGAVLQMAAALPNWLAPGQGISGTNLAATTITALDFVNNKITVAVGPTGAVGNITITQPQLSLGLPAGISTPANNHALFSFGTQPNLQTYSQPSTVGTLASASLGTGNNYTMMRVGGYTNGVSFFRVVEQTGDTSAGFTFNVSTNTFQPHSEPAVFGFTRLIQAVKWWAEDKSGTGSTGADPGVTALTTGSLGFSQQFSAAGAVFGGDYESYAELIYPTDLGTTNGALLNTSLRSAFAKTPSVKSAVCDGSSTTRGTGDQITNNVCRRLADLIGNVRAIDVGTGQSIEAMLQNYATSGPGLVFDSTNSKLLIVHPGLGNSLQAGGTVAVSSNDSITFTTAAQNYPSFFSLNAWVSIAGAGCPSSTQITAVNSTVSPTVFTSSASLAGCTATSVTSLNETGAQVWSNIIAYLQLARASGYKILLVGSATRGTFTGSQATEFNNAKALIAANALTYADAYLDLSNIPQFAGNGSATPWVTWPTYWQIDDQHFTGLGYQLIAANENIALKAAGLSP